MQQEMQFAHIDAESDRRRPEPVSDGTAGVCVDQLRTGNHRANQQMMELLYPHVYRYLLYLVGNSETAADLTQDTFIRAWDNLNSFRGGVPLQHWVYRIAYREYLQ